MSSYQVNSTGTALVYSTYLEGIWRRGGIKCCGFSGNAYVTSPRVVCVFQLHPGICETL